MKSPIFCIGFLAFLITVVSGRSTNSGGLVSNDPSRTLKGVLKFYKEQPRVSDSESLEFESGEGSEKNEGSYRLELGKEELQRLANVVEETNKLSQADLPKIIKVSQPSVEDKNVEPDSTETTTFLPSMSEDELLKAQQMSKSDLYGDDPEEMDGCNEADVLKVSCNTCVCVDGKYLCSKKDCHDKQKPYPPIPKSSYKRKGAIKYHSTKFDVTSDNETSIVGDGQLIDGNSTSSGENVNNNTVISAAQCIDGRTKPVDCNQCVCALGMWACTKQTCIALSLREKASFNGADFLKNVHTLKESLSIDEDCMESETKQLGCNQCVCHQNSWACTDFKCPPTPAPLIMQDVEEACQAEEDVKSKDCNICSCRRGIWVCTQNDCKKFGNRYYNPISQQQQHTSNENEQDI